MSWSRVLGQSRVKDLLRRLFEAGRLPHALLFHGPAGVGKEAAGIELARTLNCSSGGWAACGTCASCRAIDALAHPRLKLVFPLPSKADEDDAVEKLSDAEIAEMRAQIALKAENPYHRIVMPRAAGIKVSSVRAVRREAAFRASGVGRTVVLVCEADRMNASASNALLKTLEEPGGDLLFVLCTDRRDVVLPTVRSRCQHVRFDPLAESEIASALVAAHEASPDDAALAAHLANGSYTAAVALVEEEGLLGRDDILAFVRAVVRGDPAQLLPMLGEFGKRERPVLVSFLAGVETWFRDVVAASVGAGEYLINAPLRDSIDKFAARYGTTARCDLAIETIESSIDLLTKNVQVMTVLTALAQRLRTCIVAPERAELPFQTHA